MAIFTARVARPSGVPHGTSARARLEVRLCEESRHSGRLINTDPILVDVPSSGVATFQAVASDQLVTKSGKAALWSVVERWFDTSGAEIRAGYSEWGERFYLRSSGGDLAHQLTVPPGIPGIHVGGVDPAEAWGVTITRGDFWIDTSGGEIFERVEVTVGVLTQEEWVPRGHLAQLTDLQLAAYIEDSGSASRSAVESIVQGAVPAATITQSGLMRFATAAETIQGSSGSAAVSPASLAAFESDRRPNRPVAVFVGSSNVVGPSSTMWTTILSGYMGWTEKNFAVGGARYGTGPNNYLSQLQAASADSSFPNSTVGFVFIADASNNVRDKADAASMANWTNSAYAYARSQWPAARIIVLPVIWPASARRFAPAIIGGFDPGWMPALQVAADAQRVWAKNNRVEFIEDSWTWLTGNDSLMIAEGDVHPGNAGNLEIARWVMRYLRGESTTPVTKWERLASVDPAYYTHGTDWTGSLDVRRVGWDVQIRGGAKAANSAAANSNWFQLPKGFEPEIQAGGYAYNESDGGLVPFEVHPAGLLRNKRATSGIQKLIFDFRFFVG